MSRLVSLVAVIVVASLVLLACAPPAAPTAAPTKPAAPAAPTAAPSAPTAAAPTATAKPAATATPAVKIKRGGTLRYGKSNEWQPSLDPHQNTGWPAGQDVIFSSMTRGKFDENTKQWSLGPGLAESWEQPDAKTIVFKLRKGVTFHDGSAFNAEVARWNFDRMMNHPKSGAKTEAGIIESMQVVDDYTLRLNLKSPPAGFLGQISDSGFIGRMWIGSKEAAEKMGDDYIARHPVGSGPMTFVEWKAGDSMTVKKWDKYWEKGEDGQPLPYLDGIVYRLIIDPTVRTLEIRTGNIDVSDSVPLKDIPAVKADPNLEFVEYHWSAELHYIPFNTQKAPFDNVKLRQAAAYALDRDSLAKAIGMGAGYPHAHFWAPGVLGYDETLPKYTYQPDKAKQLVKEAGFPDGVSAEGSFFTSGAIPRHAEAVKQMWEAVGIRLTLDVMERTAFVSKLQTGGHQVAFSTRSASVMDPHEYCFRLCSDGVFNFAGWKNAEFDKCMEEGLNTTDEKKRAETYKRCQKFVYDEVPYTETFYTPRNVVVNKKVKGWLPHRAFETRLTWAWLDK
ncbi:MAG: ABC transporter substrate-binding protein [Chloroflexi bacterium]|nr:ABC transporter substrate-binding protein [Chloroflexota bacterium]